MTRLAFAILPGFAIALLGFVSPVTAAEEGVIELAGGKLQMTAPEDWVQKKPKFAGIVQYEFSVPAVEGDPSDLRVTVGGAGGGLEANRRRWLGQYSQPDGGSTEDRAKQEKETIAGCTVHTIDVSGTFNAPPFEPGGGGPRKKYRALIAVLDAGELGSYYVKFYGPARTVEKHSGDFLKMVRGLKRT